MRRVLLIGSLVLNALLIGFVIGDLARPIRAAQSLGDYATHYPESIRTDLRANVIADRRDLIAGFRAFRDARAALFEAMRAPEFDRERVAAAMAAVRVETTAMQTLLQAATLDAVEAASPAERADIQTPSSGRRMFGLND